MPYKVDTEIDLETKLPKLNIKYVIHSHHRRRVGSPHKCFWIISNVEEVNCFVEAAQLKWIDGHFGWGLRFVNNYLQVIGRNTVRQELKMAKFVSTTGKNVWHGYPADYMNRAGDRPSTLILKDWVSKGIITKAKMTKIRTGLPCSL